MIALLLTLFAVVIAMGMIGEWWMGRNGGGDG